jgi:hypothetical protein
MLFGGAHWGLDSSFGDAPERQRSGRAPDAVTSSKSARQVRYYSVFGELSWLPKADAEAKLEHERMLYDRWKGRVEHGIFPPRIEEQ